MNILNYILPYKYYIIFIILILLIIIIIILTSLCCYVLYKYYHIKFNKIYLENYYGDSDKILSEYGDSRIKNVYIVKEKLNNGLHVVILNNIIKYILKKEYDIGNLNHISLYFDIDLGNNIIKKIKINKNLFLNISENFNVSGYKQIIKCNKIKNKKYTLNYILDKTKKHINSKKYYNWDINNNCQYFTNKVLLSMKLLNNNNLRFMEYINTKKFTKEMGKKEEIYIYIFNLLLNITKYIYKIIF